ncbi:hypothetical protein CW304_33130 [Bacillus sp. UFRGS-B20]|nr:hypothetical protein CW304_33130 [Bacillus sp. UFRGS-B20]
MRFRYRLRLDFIACVRSNSRTLTRGATGHLLPPSAQTVIVCCHRFCAGIPASAAEQLRYHHIVHPLHGFGNDVDRLHGATVAFGQFCQVISLRTGHRSAANGKESRRMVRHVGLRRCRGMPMAHDTWRMRAGEGSQAHQRGVPRTLSFFRQLNAALMTGRRITPRRQ